MRVVCIDFETANRFIGSICSVGIAIIEEGKLVDSRSWLVRPHPDFFYFDYFNTKIHGMRAEDVAGAQEFDRVYEEMLPYFKDSVLAAHNAQFDMSALKSVLNLYGIPNPEMQYICSCNTSRRMWKHLQSHKLNVVCDFLNFKFKHHDAAEDAVACAQILIAAMREKGVADVEELARCIGCQIKCT